VKAYFGSGLDAESDSGSFGAATCTNSQSLNRYAYVGNNPTSNVDPSGLFVAAGGNWMSEDNCTVDGLGIPCGFVGQNSVLGAPGGSPTGAQELSMEAASQDFTLVAGVNGWVWINDLNGEEINSYGMEDAGLPDLNGNSDADAPPAGFTVTPASYQGAFNQGYGAALKKDLKRKKCGSFFGGQGPATINSTWYRFLSLNNPNVGAATVSVTSVFINSAGPYMTYSPAPGQPGPFGLFWTQSQFRAFILLHELGHQLSRSPDFNPMLPILHLISSSLCKSSGPALNS
jgi:hypothetical protein